MLTTVTLRPRFFHVWIRPPAPRTSSSGCGLTISSGPSGGIQSGASASARCHALSSIPVREGPVMLRVMAVDMVFAVCAIGMSAECAERQATAISPATRMLSDNSDAISRAARLLGKGTGLGLSMKHGLAVHEIEAVARPPWALDLTRLVALAPRTHPTDGVDVFGCHAPWSGLTIQHVKPSPACIGRTRHSGRRRYHSMPGSIA